MSTDLKMKQVYRPLLYILIALAFWALCIGINVLNKNGLLNRLEMVRPYTLKKQIPKWQDAFDNAVKKINTEWTTALDSTCFTLTDLSANTNCQNSRKNLVLNVRTELSCTAAGYRSPFCSCVQKVLDTVLKDTRSASTPSLATETFSYNPLKNVAGKKDQLIQNIESCHYLYHPTTVAEQNDNGTTRYGVIMYMISTLVTLVLVDAFVLKNIDGIYHYFAVVAFVALLLFVPYGFFFDSMNFTNFVVLHLYVYLPSVLIYVWTEALMYNNGESLKKYFPILHPGYFGALHALMMLLALTQHGVLDLDVINVELCKSGVMAFLYLNLCLYCTGDHDRRAKTTNWWDEPILYTTITILALSFSSAAAPYPSSSESNVLWSIPFLFTGLSVLYALWMAHSNRFQTKSPDNIAYGDYSNTFTDSAYYMSVFLLFIVATILWVGVSDYWRVERLFVDKYLVNTIQFNQTNWAWMNPVFASSAF